MRGDDEVAQLAPGKRRRAVGMLEMEERVPQQALLQGLDHNQREAFDIPQLIGHIHRRRHRSVETAWRRGPLVMTGGRERNSPRALQYLQRLEAARKLRSPPGIDKPELAAHALPDHGTPRARSACCVIISAAIPSPCSSSPLRGVRSPTPSTACLGTGPLVCVKMNHPILIGAPLGADPPKKYRWKSGRYGESTPDVAKGVQYEA